MAVQRKLPRRTRTDIAPPISPKLTDHGDDSHQSFSGESVMSESLTESE